MCFVYLLSHHNDNIIFFIVIILFDCTRAAYHDIDFIYYMSCKFMSQYERIS